MPNPAPKKAPGRPKGAPNKRTVAIRAVTDEAVARGITPLEVMLEAMRHFHDAGQLKDAAAVAKDAAPYVHPRLAQVEHQGNNEKPMRLVFGWAPSNKE